VKNCSSENAMLPLSFDMAIQNASIKKYKITRLSFTSFQFIADNFGDRFLIVCSEGNRDSCLNEWKKHFHEHMNKVKPFSEIHIGVHGPKDQAHLEYLMKLLDEEKTFYPALNTEFHDEVGRKKYNLHIRPYLGYMKPMTQIKTFLDGDDDVIIKDTNIMFDDEKYIDMLTPFIVNVKCCLIVNKGNVT
jgi:hypothetical protein